MTESGDIFDGLGLGRKRVIGKRCRIGRFAFRLARCGLRYLGCRVDCLSLSMVRIVFADSSRRNCAVVISPGVSDFAPVVAESGDIFDGLGLGRKRGIGERCRVGGFTLCLASCGLRYLGGRVDHLGLNVACVAFARPCRRYAAVVISPGVCDFAPVVAKSGDIFDGLGLRFKRVIGKRCGVGRFAFRLARSLIGNRRGRVDGLGFNVACVASARPCRRNCAVVISPCISRSVPVVLAFYDRIRIVILGIRLCIFDTSIIGVNQVQPVAVVGFALVFISVCRKISAGDKAFRRVIAVRVDVAAEKSAGNRNIRRLCLFDGEVMCVNTAGGRNVRSVAEYTSFKRSAA